MRGIGKIQVLLLCQYLQPCMHACMQARKQASQQASMQVLACVHFHSWPCTIQRQHEQGRTQPTVPMPTCVCAARGSVCFWSLPRSSFTPLGVPWWVWQPGAVSPWMPRDGQGLRPPPPSTNHTTGSPKAPRRVMQSWTRKGVEIGAGALGTWRGGGMGRCTQGEGACMQAGMHAPP